MKAKKKIASHVEFQDGCYVTFDSNDNVSGFYVSNVECHDHSTFRLIQNENADSKESETLGEIARDYVE